MGAMGFYMQPEELCCTVGAMRELGELRKSYGGAIGGAIGRAEGHMWELAEL